MKKDKKRRDKRFSMARKMGKAYVESKEKKRTEIDISPLSTHEAYSGYGILHLRKEERGEGALIVNGSTIVHLNPTAFQYLSMLFKELDATTIVKRITRRYKVRPSIARADLETLIKDLVRLESGVLPKRGSRVDPLTGPYYSPLRVDLALTYRTIPKALGEASSPEAEGELSTTKSLEVLDRLWTFGIPHVCLTGGEPTVRDDLEEIIDHARSLGFMVGLLTNGERVGNKAYLGRLMEVGLSYMQISLASHDEEVHAKVTGSHDQRKTVNGIRNAIKAGMPLLVNIPITKESEYGLEDTVDFLIGLKVEHISVHAQDLGDDTMPDWMFEKTLERARKAARSRANIFFFGPVQGKDPRGEGVPEQFGELAMGKLDWGAGRVHIHVHPDGIVVPGRGYGLKLGNVLTHNWNMLWYHSALKEIRGKRLEHRRWRNLQDIGFTGYPFFPGLKVNPASED